MFFQYHQNNSGGSFIVNDEVTYDVIIEAASAAEADSKAETIGIYFDGVDKSIDCDCCGDRWYSQHGWMGADRGDEVPSHYGTPLEEALAEKPFIDWASSEEYNFYVYFADGTVEKHRYQNR